MVQCKICSKNLESEGYYDQLGYCSKACLEQSFAYRDAKTILITLTEKLSEKDRELLTYLIASDSRLIWEIYTDLGGKIGIEAWGLW